MDYEKEDIIAEETNNKEEVFCFKCNSVMRFIPAGISRKTGKPYDAFFSCPECLNTYTPKIEKKDQGQQPSYDKIIEKRIQEKNQRIQALHEDTKDNISWISAMKGALEIIRHPIYMDLKDHTEIKEVLISWRNWFYKELTNNKEYNKE